MNELAKALSNYKESKDLSLRALAGELGVQHGTAESLDERLAQARLQSIYPASWKSSRSMRSRFIGG